MSKKSTQKKRKYKVKVKTVNKNNNTNRIVIKIDNSERRKTKGKRRKKEKPKAEEPQVQKTVRIFSDIGDYTKEIENRNAAIRAERELTASQGQKLGTANPSSVSVIATPVSTPRSSTPRSSTGTAFTEPVSAQRLGSITRTPPVKLDVIETPGDLSPPPEIGIFKRSRAVDGLDLATTTSTPAAVRKLKDEVKPTKQTANKIFQKFDSDMSVTDPEDASFLKFSQWAMLNGDIKINQRNYIRDYSISALEKYFYSRFD